MPSSVASTMPAKPSQNTGPSAVSDAPDKRLVVRQTQEPIVPGFEYWTLDPLQAKGHGVHFAEPIIEAGQLLLLIRINTYRSVN